MKYIIFWTDNEKCRNRGAGEDNFSKDVYEFNSDREALMKAIEIQNNDEVDYDDFKEHTDEDLKGCLYDIDLGFGDPVVFWIKRNGKKIYDAGISLKDW